MIRPLAVQQRIVGRDQELGRLGSATSRAAPGAPVLVSLTGEPGMGKSALVDHFVASRRASGWVVLSGSGYDAEGAPPYWPWQQMIHELPAGLLSGADETVVDGLAPLLRRPGRAAPGFPGLAVGGGRERIAIAVASMLGAAAAPVLLVMDDAQWADEASLGLAQALLREPQPVVPLAVLLAYSRPAEGSPLARALETPYRVPHEVIELGGLDRSALARFAAGLGAENADIDDLLVRSGGNPLWAAELLARDRGGPSVPTGVFDQRLAGMAPELRAVVEVAAILGDGFDGELAAALAGVSVAQLAEAVRAGLFVTVPDGNAHRFAHGLLRETVLAGLDARRRRELHARAFSALREAGAPAAEVARHALGAVPLAEPGLLAAAVEDAGREAIACLSYEAAVEVAQRGRAALESAPGGEAHQGPLSLLLGDACLRLGRKKEAAEAFDEAALRAGDNPATLARAAIGYSAATWEAGRHVARAADLLDAALARAALTDDALRSMLMARQVWSLADSPRTRERPALAREAVSLARSSGSLEALALALWTRHLAAGTGDSDARRSGIPAELIEIAQRLGDRYIELAGRQLLVSELLEAGDLDRARTEIGSHRLLAEALREPTHRWTARAWAATVLTEAAAFEEADALIAETLAMARTAANWNVTLRSLVQRFFILRLGGRLSEVELGAGTAPFAAIPAWRAAVPLIQLAHARDDLARTEFEAIVDGGLDGLAADANAQTALAFLAETAVRLGDAQRASSIRELLLAYQGKVIVVADGIALLGPADLYQGRLALVLEETETARREIASGLVLAERLGGHHLAEALLATASLRLATGDEQGALAAANNAARTAGTLFAAAAQSARALISALAPEPVAPPALPAGLSPREAEALRMAALGMGNRDIASALGVSLNTVLRQLSNAYGKAGVANRAEATAWAAAHGLLGDL